MESRVRGAGSGRSGDGLAPPRIRRWVPYVGFAAFGVFWGTWGAALPALRAQAGVSEGELGTALLFVGVGALPAMLLAGRMIDRLGARLTAPLLAALALAGLGVAVGAHSRATLVAGMLLVGASSGAADVAINTVSGQVEADSARPVLTRAHGVFSLAVVAASVTGGFVLSGPTAAGSSGGGSPGLTWAFGVAGVAVTVLSLLIRVGTRGGSASGASAGSDHPPRRRPRTASVVVAAFVAVGLVGALAYATENAHQSWGAVFLTDAFAASAPTASLAPAAFAAASAAARLLLAPLSRTHPVPLLLAGGAVAAIGSLVVATSTSVGTALVGLGVAAVGTATLFPTLLSTSLRGVPARDRGRATSIVATTAYLGFLLGPAYVGLLADHVGLRGAVVGVAVLAVVFTFAARPLISRTLRSTPAEAEPVP